MGRKLGLLLVTLALVIPASATGKAGTISGTVRNSAGVPQIAAMVEILAPASSGLDVFQGVKLFTDADGAFHSGELPPGTYEVRVSAPSYLPSLEPKVILRAGASFVLNITLNSIFDAMQMMPARRTGPGHEDWNWTLRSAANRPILRVFDDDRPAASAPEGDRESSSLKAKVAFLAGSDAEGFGSPGQMSTRFTLERSVFSSGTLALKGDVGSGSGPQGVLRASYSQTLPDGSIAEFAATVRRFATPDFVAHDTALEALALRAADTFKLGDSIELKLGSEFQTIQFMRSVSALRPFGSIAVHLSPDMVAEYQYTTSRPDTRAIKGFDSAPADLSESGPQFDLDNGRAVLEHSQHQEIALSRRMGNSRFRVAAYRDSIRDAALVGAADSFTALPGILPDIYSGTFTYNAGELTTHGFRVVAERSLSPSLTANITYSYGGVLDLAEGSRDWSQLGFRQVSRHGVSGALSGDLPTTHTHWIASYKWTSGRALNPVDMFNNAPGQSDPYLNLFLRQPLPGSGFLPGRFEALVELRNLLAQGYIPVVAPDGQTVYLVQSARAVRGGLAFVF